MEIATYHIDAFADKFFAGNPAAVCILSEWLPDVTLQKIAAENFLPATAFLVPTANHFETRWFAPEYEIDLCGHGSLASAFVIFNELKFPQTTMQLLHPKQGEITISKDNEWLVLNFLSKDIEEISIDENLIKGLGVKPQAVYRYKNERCLAILASESEVKNLQPNAEVLKQLPYRGFIVTAKGEEVDFVSRVFYPYKAIFEDAVTGSSYCLLVPYWLKQLNKQTFHARQLSQRGGEVKCKYENGNILLFGKATLFKRSIIFLNDGQSQ